MSICQPVEAGARALLEAEARTEMRLLEGWHLLQENSVWRLVKSYPTASFLQSLALAQRIGRLAQSENHHPEIVVAWGRCTVSWWTTSLNGIHANDVRMAAATDELLYGGQPAA
ncbi:MAG: 4a-hydroxytetrahydrobiopterin dehydratase [bacterium]|nr:4a-hydroxytetrahydrobiopterin dehydratase [bacterium]